MRPASAAPPPVSIVICLRHLPLATINTVLSNAPRRNGRRRPRLSRTRVDSTLGGGAHGLPGSCADGGAPDAASFGAGASFMLIALLFTTIRDLTTRGLASDIPIFAAAAISTAGFAVAAFADPWRWPCERPGSGRRWRQLPVHRHCLHGSPCAGGGFGGGPFRYVPVPCPFCSMGGGGTRCRIGLPAWGLFSCSRRAFTCAIVSGSA